MGYYIQHPDGPTHTHGKAQAIVTHYGAVITDGPKMEPHKATICVVDNGLFEAAAFAYSPGEMEAFTLPEDTRPKTWLVMDWDKACELSGYMGS